MPVLWVNKSPFWLELIWARFWSLWSKVPTNTISGDSYLPFSHLQICCFSFMPTVPPVLVAACQPSGNQGLWLLWDTCLLEWIPSDDLPGPLHFDGEACGNLASPHNDFPSTFLGQLQPYDLECKVPAAKKKLLSTSNDLSMLDMDSQSLDYAPSLAWASCTSGLLQGQSPRGHCVWTGIMGSVINTRNLLTTGTP